MDNNSKIIDIVKDVRNNTQIPMIFMTYANIVFSYGAERFIKRAAELEMYGLILPDIPFEEKEEFDGICQKYGLVLISMIAPTSHDRICMIAKEAKGFLYCVSLLGVTGTRSEITTDIGAMIKIVREETDIPCAVGFGISILEQAEKMAAVSDGVIVGFAIVKLCGKYGKDCVEYVKGMKSAMRGCEIFRLIYKIVRGRKNFGLVNYFTNMNALLWRIYPNLVNIFCSAY